MSRLSQIQLRRGTAATWTDVDPVLADGEPGWESDTNKLKIGDGTSRWSELPYLTGGGGGGGLVDSDYGDVTVSGGGTVMTVDTGAVQASEVVNTPSGSIASTNVQAAINELDSEKADAAATAAALATKSDVGHLHPGVYDPAGTAAAAVSAHEAASDPHTGYQRESEKAAANGYASLGAGALVPTAQLATGTPDGTKFLRDDQVWAAPVTFIIENRTDDPASPEEGRIWLRTDL